METKQVLQEIIKTFNVSPYWLEKFLNVEHAKFNRYIRGINEARFSDINKWLSQLGLYVYDDNLYCVEHINNHKKVPLFQESSLFIDAKFSSILDNIQWNKTNKQLEQKNGHKIFWGSISQLAK